MCLLGRGGFALAIFGSIGVMEEFILEESGFCVHIYCDDEDTQARLVEAQHRGVPLKGPYSARKERPHTPAGKTHLQIYNKKTQIFAINRDGTAHDKSHGFRIPNKVATAIRRHFPDFELPDGNLIESTPTEVDTAIALTEVLAGKSTRDTIIALIRRERRV